MATVSVFCYCDIDFSDLGTILSCDYDLHMVGIFY